VVEAHQVQRLARQAGLVVRKLLGIAEYALQAHDGAALAAQVRRRAAVPARLARAHPHLRAGLEARAHGFASARARNSSSLRARSASLITPCSMTSLRIAYSHFS